LGFFALRFFLSIIKELLNTRKLVIENLKVGKILSAHIMQDVNLFNLMIFNIENNNLVW